MSQLDDLLAQRAAGGAPTLASSVPAGAAPAASTPLDAMLAARAGGAQLPAAQPADANSGGFGDLVTAAGHHLLKPLHGAAQIVENGAAKLFGLLPDNPVSRAVSQTAVQDNQALNDWETAYQKSVPNGPWASTGAVAGEVAPFFISGPAQALKGLGNLAEAGLAKLTANKLAGKVASGAAQGAAIGAVQPVDTSTSLSDLVGGGAPASYWDQKLHQVEGGAAFGGAVPIASTGVGAAWNRAKAAALPVVNPSKYAGQQLGVQLGADAPTVANDLANAPQYVPGSVPTAAQAGANPRLVQIEKALANQDANFKAALAARENANNAARLQVVGDVAQTPAALQAAIDSRNAATGTMRSRVVDNGNPVPVDGIQAQLASLQGGALGVRPTIGGAAGSMRTAVDDFTNVVPPNTLTNTPGSATAPPAMLDALRQNANDYLSKYAPNGVVGTQEQAAMMPVKSAIIDAIDAANPRQAPGGGGWGQGLEQAGPTAPGYRDYLAEFAKRSVPINTMELGQQLQAKLQAGSLNSAGDASATLPGYRSALAQALRNSDYAIDPKAQAALEGVQSDLQRATISNSIKSGGSDTAYNAGAGKEFLRALGAADGSNVPAAVAGAGTLAATGSTAAAAGAAVGAKKASNWVTGRVATALGELLLDPQALAEALNAPAQPLAATAPSAFGRLGARLTPAAKNALLVQLLQTQAPQVVGRDRDQANAYQH